MRIAICALSAVLLSGCSWLGGINNVFGGHGAQGSYNQQAGQYGQAVRNVQYGANGQNAQYGQYGQNFGGGFPQEPQFGAPQQVTGQYGTHAGNAQQSYAHQRPGKQMRKPRLRGSLSLGLEKSTSGDLLDSNFEVGPFSNNSVGTGFGFFQNDGFSGSPVDGLTISSDLTATPTSTRSPSISFDDVHSTPLRIAGGLEYIATPKTTVFANLGYSTAEGNEGGAIDVIGTVAGNVTFDGYRQNVFSGTTTLGRSVENLPIVQIATDFSDLERYDAEVGVRHYFNPLKKGNFSRAVTPFVAASVGLAHYNGVSFKAERQNLDLHEAVADTETSIIYRPQRNSDAPVQLYDSQWVGLGQLNAGLEWQATPKMAIAFETGVKYEGARDYSDTIASDGSTIDGPKGDNNISVPFTIRGSYNF